MKSNSSFSLRVATGFLLLASVIAISNRALAQVQGQGPSVTVQLPEIHIFGASTTVLVPDRGTAYMGGIGSSSYGSSSYGGPIVPFRNRGIGHSAGASSFSVSAWIHDFNAMDQLLLEEAQRRRAGSVETQLAVPQLESKADSTLLSAEEYARRQSLKQDEQQAEAQRHFEKAKALLAEGKSGVAKIYFQMALRRAEGPLKAEIAAALKASRGPQVAAESM